MARPLWLLTVLSLAPLAPAQQLTSSKANGEPARRANAPLYESAYASYRPVPIDEQTPDVLWKQMNQDLLSTGSSGHGAHGTHAASPAANSSPVHEHGTAQAPTGATGKASNSAPVDHSMHAAPAQSATPKAPPAKPTDPHAAHKH